jgi:hypothetical protein
MSFGKRGRPQASVARGSNRGVAGGAGAPPPPAAPERAGPDEPSSSPSVLWQQLRGLGIGVAIALGIYLAYYIGMRGVGRALDSHWSNLGGGVEWTAIVPLPSQPQTQTQRQLRDACLKLQSVRISPKVSEEFGFNLQLGNSQRARLAAIGSYLACSTEQLRERFCRPEERVALVEQLRLYLKLRQAVLTGPDFTLEDQDPMRRMQQIVTRPADEGAHEHLVRALRALVERGLLSSRDFGTFGFGVPEEFSQSVKGAQIKERSCP